MNLLFLILVEQFLLVLSTRCKGTCYSGNFFPIDENIFTGKYIKDRTYKRITVSSHTACYNKCINDCRCKACQIKGSQCELLNGDSRFCGLTFSIDPGYVFYDLIQTQYKEASHKAAVNLCSNGCCSSHPCLNGGTCEDLCENPKQKFFCHCKYPYSGEVCQDKVSSCFDLLRNSPKTPPANGIYTVYRSDKHQPIKVYCDFTNPDNAWTLIESFAYSFNGEYESKAFDDNFPRNTNYSQLWTDYRMSRQDMKYIRSKSLLFRATCEFNNIVDNNLGPDYLIGSLAQYDIIDKSYSFNECQRYMLISIRNKQYSNMTAPTYSVSGTYHLHVDTANCGFDVADKIDGEEFFGFYHPPNPAFKCTESQKSTTQWWLGSRIRGKC